MIQYCAPALVKAIRITVFPILTVGSNNEEENTMKKNIARFLLLTAVISLAAGCAREEFSKINRNSLVFTATIDAGTRTAIDIDGTAGKVYWVEGDEILINGVAYTAAPDASDARMATFTKKDASAADPEAVGGKYYATYCSTFDAASGEGVIPASQSYQSAGTISAPMYAESETTTLDFKNICSLMEITLKGTASVKTIELSSDNLGMSGTFTVTDGQTAVLADAQKTTAKLDCGSGVALTSEGTPFYIAVPQGDYDGFKVSVTSTDGKKWSKTATKTASVEVNMIYRFSFTPEFAAVNAVARYSDDAGSTWTDASSLAEAIEAVSGTSTTSSYVELLKNDELGEIDLPDLSGKKITISSDGKVWNVSERTKEFVTDAGTDVIFKNIAIDGDDASNDYRFIDNYGKITFGDGAEISNFIYNASSSKGGVIANNKGANIDIDGAYIHDCLASRSNGDCYGGLIANYGGNIDMENGIIDNCRCEAPSDMNARGGFFYSTYVDDDEKTIGTATITGGQIIGCYALNGGAIYTFSGDISISNVTFTDCSANVGSVIHVYSRNAEQPSTVDFVNCVFEGCTAATRAGIMQVSAATAAVSMEGCEVTNCSSPAEGGSIYVSAGILDMTSCTLDGDSRDILYIYSGGTVNIDQCEFNYTGTNYAIRGEGKDKKSTGVINFTDSKITSAASGLFSKYSTINLTSSEIVVYGSYGMYMLTGGKFTVEETKIANLKEGAGYVFYSGTTNSASNLSVNSGWFYGNSMAACYTTGNSRIYINGGYFSKGAEGFDDTIQYATGVSIQSVSPVTATIDGTDYTFSYIAM